jgi:hypothetical protein
MARHARVRRLSQDQLMTATTHQISCPVYNWDNRDNVGAAVHLVRNEGGTRLR